MGDLLMMTPKAIEAKIRRSQRAQRIRNTVIVGCEGPSIAPVYLQRATGPSYKPFDYRDPERKGRKQRESGRLKDFTPEQLAFFERQRQERARSQTSEGRSVPLKEAKRIACAWPKGRENKFFDPETNMLLSEYKAEYQELFQLTFADEETREVKATDVCRNWEPYEKESPFAIPPSRFMEAATAFTDKSGKKHYNFR